MCSHYSLFMKLDAKSYSCPGSAIKISLKNPGDRWLSGYAPKSNVLFASEPSRPSKISSKFVDNFNELSLGQTERQTDKQTKQVLGTVPFQCLLPGYPLHARVPGYVTGTRVGIPKIRLKLSLISRFQEIQTSIERHLGM